MQKLTFNKRLQSFQCATDTAQCQKHGSAESEVGGWLIPSNPSYFDKYCSSPTGELHVHFRWVDNRPIGSQLRNFEADYCVILGKVTASEANDCARDSLTFNKEVDTKMFDSSTNCNKPTMLIGVFEATDNANGVSMYVSPKVIRLRLYDDCDRTLWQPLDGGGKSISCLGVIDYEAFIRISLPNVSKLDWETSAFFSLFGNASNNDMVKCTSQVVYEVTEHDGNHRVRMFSDLHTVPDLTLAIWEPHTSEFVRLSASVVSGCSIDFYHVLLGTLDLEPPGINHRVHPNYRQVTDNSVDLGLGKRQ